MALNHEKKDRHLYPLFGFSFFVETSLPPTAEACDERGFRCPGCACGRFRESIVTLAGAFKPARAGIPHGMAIAVCQVRIAAQ